MADPQPALGNTPVDEAALVNRIREGDREAAALFVAKYGDLIRRRVRSRLGSSVRRVFDSTDILSTIMRRLDSYVFERRAAVHSSDDLWFLVHQMSKHAVIDKARIVQRIHRVESDVADTSHRAAEEPERADPGEVERVMATLDESDQHLVRLVLLGSTSEQVAAALEIQAPAVRKRWERIRTRLRPLAAEVGS